MATFMLTVIPAYGRDYTSKKALLEAWNGDKDFQISDVSAGRDNGRYINRNDAISAGIVTIKARYSKLRKVTMFQVIQSSKKLQVK